MSIEAQEDLWQAVRLRDAGRDGAFYYAVKSTGIYCRPSCPSRRPRRTQVAFYATTSEAERAGFRACRRCRPAEAKPQGRVIEELCRYIEAHADEQLTLTALGRLAGMSSFHLQRVFKAEIGISPREYQSAVRIAAVKEHLKSGKSVTEALYEAGYGSSSRLYETAKPQMGMDPGAYRKGAPGTEIAYTIADSPLGMMLVGSTQKGICAVSFGKSEAELAGCLRAEFPAATVRREPQVPWLPDILAHLEGRKPNPALPLDIRATAFQQIVWEYLGSIPYGSTSSYSEVAAGIGQPKAARAVARACATNRIAVLIPCHRVVKESGDPGGYRCGLKRKAQLLQMEAERINAAD